MKKTTFLAFVTLLLFNSVNAQVLYNENFDFYNLGNLTNDVTGVNPGQGGWITESNDGLGNPGANVYSVTNYINKGKVLTFAVPINIKGHFTVRKTKLNTLIDKRKSGNNVIKFELDYYTGPQHRTPPNSQDASIIYLTNSNQLTPISGDILIGFTFNAKYGHVYYECSHGERGIINERRYLNNDPRAETKLPFYTWIKLNVYLDYNNKKAYFETPYLGTVVVSDFLQLSTSTNLANDDKYKITSVIFQTSTEDQNRSLSTDNKYDNIKLIALDSVPPEVIALSTNEQLSKKFNLYPNPATNIVNITNSENLSVKQVSIYDVAGKLVNTQIFNNEIDIQLNIERLASSTYMLHLQTEEGTAVKKLIKKVN